MTRRVLVTDAGRGSALAVIRELGRRGWHVVAADSRTSTIGAASRYAAATEVYPSAFQGPGADTAAAVFEIARRHRVDLVVPVSDDVLLPLAAHRHAAPAGVALAIAPDGALHTAADKAATLDLARGLDIPIPETRVVTDAEDARGLLDELGAPVVVKPSRSRVFGPDGRLRKAEVSYAWNDDQLVAAIGAARQPVLVQAYHSGEGQGIGMVLGHGRPLVAVAHRRLHEVPVTGGASALRETVELDPVLLDQATRLLGALNWTGAAMVEFKVGATDTTLMEVNGRLWGSLPLAVHSGADIVGCLADVHLGVDRPAGPIDLYDRGVRSRNLDLELVWIASTLRGRHRFAALAPPGRREGILAAAQLMRRGQCDDVFSSDDRRPGVTGMRDVVTHLTRKVRNGR